MATTPAVATGHPAVTEAACTVLAAGGNAFDAIVAAGCASGVVEPALSSLGGGGFLLGRLAGGHAVLFDFFVDVPGRGAPAGASPPALLPVTVRFPGSEQVFHAGLGAVAVPGVLRGYLHAHRRLGVLPLAEVVAPAVALARDGVIVNEHQGYFLSLLEPIMTLTEEARRIFAPGGRYLQVGDRLRNADLAAFLEALAEGSDAVLYDGAVAQAIARDMAAGGGRLSAADLAAYRVIERTPLTVRYRDATLLTNPPPSLGGALLALAFRLLEDVDLLATPRGSAAHLQTLVEVMREVEHCRAEGGRGWDALAPELVAAGRQRLRTALGGTTHLSVVDAAGNAASMTISNGECSGYIAPGTGIMLNNMMGEDDLHEDGAPPDLPGRRLASMMSPSIVLGDEQLRLVVGSGGSKRIRTAILQVVSDFIDFESPIDVAVHAPRLHWDGTCVQVEPGFDAAATDPLAVALPVNVWHVQDVYFGGVHAVTPGGAAADPRRGGSARVLTG